MSPLPILLDTDPGVDDALALLLALRSPELELVAPTALLLFGNIPGKALVDRTFAMGMSHGQWLDTTIGPPAIATYHPAYLLRMEGDDYERTERVILTDLKKVRERCP